MAVLSEIDMHAVARGQGGGRGALLETMLFQQAAQCASSVRSAVTIAIEDEQIAFCQVNGGKRAWVCTPHLRHGFRVGRAQRAPLDQRLFVGAAGKNSHAGFG